MSELARWVQVRDIVRRSLRLGLWCKGHHNEGSTRAPIKKERQTQGHGRTPATGSLPFRARRPGAAIVSHESKTRVGGISGSSSEACASFKFFGRRSSAGIRSIPLAGIRLPAKREGNTRFRSYQERCPSDSAARVRSMDKGQKIVGNVNVIARPAAGRRTGSQRSSMKAYWPRDATIASAGYVGPGWAA